MVSKSEIDRLYTQSLQFDSAYDYEVARAMGVDLREHKREAWFTLQTELDKGGDSRGF